MEEKIVEMMIEILGISKDALIDAIDSREIWDSLQKVEIVFSIEDEFEIELNENELANLSTPKKLIDTVIKKVG